MSVTLTQIAFAKSNYDLSGTWKIMDDKSGFTLVKVKMSKQPNSTYNGEIIEAFNLPNTPPKDLSGVAGFKLLTGLQQDANNPRHFKNGRLVDPAINTSYEVYGRVNSRNTILILRSNADQDKSSRQLSWVRIKN